LDDVSTAVILIDYVVFSVSGNAAVFLATSRSESGLIDKLLGVVLALIRIRLNLTSNHSTTVPARLQLTVEH